MCTGIGIVLLLFFFKPYVYVSHTVTQNENYPAGASYFPSRDKCSLFTQVGPLEEFYLYSQVSEGGKAKFFIDTLCLVLP